MRVTVDFDRCEYHGQCEIACPEVFKLVDDETLEFVAEPDPSLRAGVEEAIDVCPTQAIALEG